MKPSEATISCYENEVPPFVEEAMEKLYGNIFSSLTQFRIYGGSLKTISTYVAREDDSIRTIFLFQREEGRVRVLNEVIRVDSDAMCRFAEYVFSTCKQVNVISFKAIETDIERLPFPYQRFNQLEDMTLKLPATKEEYFASLGKNTRRNIKRYTDRLLRSFPTFRFEVLEREEMGAAHIHRLVDFKRQRMEHKNILSSIDEEETQRIIELVHACGLTGIATIDGRIAAGAVSFRSGSNYFLNVISHDPKYDDYWIGFLCCYLTICECIARGGKEFHFLWGRYEYKFTLGAVVRNLDSVTVYRSPIQFLLNGDIAWKDAASGYIRRAKVWIKYENGFLPRKLRKAVEWMRNIKRSASHLLLRRRQIL